MDFKDIVRERYATKRFDGRTIPQASFEELQELIRLAPSSFNFQPWKVKVIADQETKQKLLPLTWNQPQVTTCSHLLVFCADTDLVGKAKMLERLLLAKGAEPEAIKGYLEAISGFAASQPQEQRLSWAQRQVYLAVGNTLNGAKELGFDSCPMEGFDPEGYTKALGLPAHLVPTTLVAIGYAADTARPKTRLAKEDVFF